MRYLLGILSILIAASCLGPSSVQAQDYAAIVASPDRSDADRNNDKKRKPEQLLAFTGVKTGMKVMDIVSSAGYSAELLARSVGPNGTVYAVNSQETADRVKDRFEPRTKQSENSRSCRAQLRRSGAAGGQQPRPRDDLFLLSRPRPYGRRPRGDEQEGVRGAEARRLFRRRRSLGQSRRWAKRDEDAASHRGEARCARKSKLPGSSSSPKAISCGIPRTRATPTSISRKLPNDEFVLKFQKP